MSFGMLPSLTCDICMTYNTGDMHSCQMHSYRQHFNHGRETGIGSSKPIGTSKELDNNRTEILRLLLVLFSRSMYIPPTAITTTENRWIDTVVTGSDRQITLAILCSLINSALKYNPSGWGLPYNHVMFNDQRELLVMLCLQVIVVLLDYQVIERPTTPPSRFSAGIRIEGGVGDSHNQESSSSDSPSNAPMPNANTTLSDQQAQRTLEVAHKNLFRFYLSRLHREQDFLFLTDGMYRILSNPMAVSKSALAPFNVLQHCSFIRCAHFLQALPNYHQATIIYIHRRAAHTFQGLPSK